MKKEDWISDKLSVTDRIGKTTASEGFLDRLKTIPDNLPSLDKVRKPIVWAAAASIAVLMALNVFSYLQNQEGSETTVGETYFSYTQKF